MKSSRILFVPLIMLFFMIGYVADLSSESNSKRTLKTEPDDFRVSLTVGPTPEFLFKRMGITFTDESIQAKDIEGLQRIFKKYGSTEVWARIATPLKPKESMKNQVDRSLTAGLTRAKIAAKLGLNFNPELGLFGYYGDVSCQMPPDFSDFPEIRLSKPWEELTIDQMADVIEQYTEIVAKKILATGVNVNIWDLGNEINFGVAGVSVKPMPGSSCLQTDPHYYKVYEKLAPELAKMSVLDLVRMLATNESEAIAWLEEHVWPYSAKNIGGSGKGNTKSRSKGKIFHTYSQVLTQIFRCYFQSIAKRGV